MLEHELSGPVNLTAPNPVTNREFTTTLGAVLRRPTLIPLPKPALWARLGRELTEALLYSSARVEPMISAAMPAILLSCCLSISTAVTTAAAPCSRQ